MPKIQVGEAWQLFLIMDNEKPIMLVAKDPNKPSIINVTEEIRILLKESSK